jgi:hypothetical protein
MKTNVERRKLRKFKKEKDLKEKWRNFFANKKRERIQRWHTNPLFKNMWDFMFIVNVCNMKIMIILGPILG